MENIVLKTGRAACGDGRALHALLADAFAGMDGRIDPPSSLKGMTRESLLAKAADEFVVTLWENGGLVGCGFGAETGDALYLSKLAVAPDRQRRGFLRRILGAMESEAIRRGLAALTLQSRVELTENHAAFGSLGFEVVGESAHPGYDRPTSLTFRKSL